MREKDRGRKDGWTGELGGFDEAEGPPVFSSLSILEADSRVVPRRLPDLFSIVFFSLYERRHENTQALARKLPPGGGSFHVGGSRVPGPNTFLIEMFIVRLRGIVGVRHRWILDKLDDRARERVKRRGRLLAVNRDRYTLSSSTHTYTHSIRISPYFPCHVISSITSAKIE